MENGYTAEGQQCRAEKNKRSEACSGCVENELLFFDFWMEHFFCLSAFRVKYLVCFPRFPCGNFFCLLFLLMKLKLLLIMDLYVCQDRLFWLIQKGLIELVFAESDQPEREPG
jgi:hypothetical protein